VSGGTGSSAGAGGPGSCRASPHRRRTSTTRKARRAACGATACGRPIAAPRSGETARAGTEPRCRRHRCSRRPVAGLQARSPRPTPSATSAPHGVTPATPAPNRLAAWRAGVPANPEPPDAHGPAVTDRVPTRPPTPPILGVSVRWGRPAARRPVAAVRAPTQSLTGLMVGEGWPEQPDARRRGAVVRVRSRSPATGTGGLLVGGGVLVRSRRQMGGMPVRLGRPDGSQPAAVVRVRSRWPAAGVGGVPVRRGRPDGRRAAVVGRAPTQSLTGLIVRTGWPEQRDARRRGAVGRVRSRSPTAGMSGLLVGGGAPVRSRRQTGGMPVGRGRLDDHFPVAAGLVRSRSPTALMGGVLVRPEGPDARKVLGLVGRGRSRWLMGPMDGVVALGSPGVRRRPGVVGRGRSPLSAAGIGRVPGRPETTGGREVPGGQRRDPGGDRRDLGGDRWGPGGAIGRCPGHSRWRRGGARATPAIPGPSRRYAAGAAARAAGPARGGGAGGGAVRSRQSGRTGATGTWARRRTPGSGIAAVTAGREASGAVTVGHREAARGTGPSRTG
jgi:hypothetical protein